MRAVLILVLLIIPQISLADVAFGFSGGINEYSLLPTELETQTFLDPGSPEFRSDVVGETALTALSGPSGKVFLAYSFNHHIGIEINHAKFEFTDAIIPTLSTTTIVGIPDCPCVFSSEQSIFTTIESKNTSAQLVGEWTPTDRQRFSIVGKIGIVQRDTTIALYDTVTTTNTSIIIDDATIGTLGLRWRVGSHFGFRIDYDYFDDPTESNFISAGIELHYGKVKKKRRD